MSCATDRIARSSTHGGAAAILPPNYPSPTLDATLVATLFRVADKNHDGWLSADEASQSAAEFVSKGDSAGKGSIDAASLRTLIDAELSQSPALQWRRRLAASLTLRPVGAHGSRASRTACTGINRAT